MYVYMCVSMCLCVYICACVCIAMCMNGCVCCVCAYVFICMCMHVYMYACMCMPFFSLPGSGRIDTAIWLHYMDSIKTAGEEARRQLHKKAACNLKQVLAATHHKTPTVRPPASYHENYSS